MTDIAVQMIGEVDWRGAARQLNHPRLWRQYINALIQRGGLEFFHPVAAYFFLLDHGVGDFTFPGQQLAQPGNFFVVLLPRKIGAAAFLVAPVRRYTVFGKVMHFTRADLHFQRAAIFRHHHSMQRLITVRLGPRNVIVELLGNRHPDVMDDAKNGKALLDVVDDHTKRAYVVELGKFQLLAAHLVPDTVNMLGPPRDFRLDIRASEFCTQTFDRRGDKGGTLDPLFFQHLGDALVGRRLQEAER